MDRAAVKKFLRGFWMVYAVLMIVFSFMAFAESRFGADMLVVAALGAVVLWAAYKSPVQKAANRALQAFFMLVIAECVGAFILGGFIPPPPLLATLFISALSLVVWRKKPA